MIGEAAAIRLEIQHLSSDKVCDIGNTEIRMDEEFVPFGNREDNTQEEGFGGADKDSAEEMEEDDLDLSDEGNECSSDGVSSWGILPDVCLRQAFAFLSDRDPAWSVVTGTMACALPLSGALASFTSLAQ